MKSLRASFKASPNRGLKHQMNETQGKSSCNNNLMMPEFFPLLTDALSEAMNAIFGIKSFMSWFSNAERIHSLRRRASWLSFGDTKWKNFKQG